MIMKPQKFKHIELIAEGIGKLFYPNVEVVIHDLATDTIAYIYNSWSNRQVGDSSHLSREDLDLTKENIIGPYQKDNSGKRSTKSITICLRHPTGIAEALLCINFNTQPLIDCQKIIDAFINTKQLSPEKPKALFENDAYDKLETFIHNYFLEKGLTLENLTKDQRLECIRVLYEKNAFKLKDSANCAASILKISRSTVYNYLTTLSLYHELRKF